MIPSHIAIAGAGLGGLTAAVALAQAGFRVTVLEQAAQLREIGAGVQIAPNSSRILSRLGVLPQLAESAVAPETLDIRSAADGGILARAALGPAAERRWGAPFLVARRADVQAALLAALARQPGAELRLGAAVQGFAADERGVTIAYRLGLLRQTLEADALIGADGLHSIVRARLGAPAKLLFGGRVAYRALVEAAAAPSFAQAPRTHLWLGRQAHLVHYPVAAGRLVNVVAIVAQAAEGPDAGWDEAGGFPHARFARWDGAAKALLQAGAEWRRWPLHEHAPLTHRHAGRVALLGDAAHAMLPFLAQGAGQAVEDAAALAAALAQAPGDVARGLARYSLARAGRAARVQRQSRRQGQIYHLAGPAALARNLFLRAQGPQRLLARFDWLYGHDASLC